MNMELVSGTLFHLTCETLAQKKVLEPFSSIECGETREKGETANPASYVCARR
jgi:hypothetical protein